MASVSASDVSDINDNQNYLAVDEESVSGDELNQNLDLSSASSDSSVAGSNLGTSTDSADSDSNLAFNDESSDELSSASSLDSGSSLGSNDESSDELSSAASDSLSSSSGSAYLKATKNSTVISKSSDKVVYGKDYSVTLKDKNGKALPNKQVIFTFNGNNYTKITNSNGIASLNINAKAGNYLIAVFFAGDELYKHSTLSTYVTVKKASTQIASITKSTVKGESYSVALKDHDGKPLSSKRVILKYNGKTYNKTTNSNGIVRFIITGRVGKTYDLTYKFAGDDYYLASSGSVSLKVKMPTRISGSNKRLFRGNKYNVTLKDAKGKALSKKTVAIFLNGKKYKKTTNSKGIISLTLKLKTGRYHNITYKYYGSSYYGASSKTVSVFIKTRTKLTNSGKSVGRGKKYYITLKDSKGNPLSKKTVIIRYNGKTFKKLTNSKGKASLKINSAIGTTSRLTYRYKGNKYYGPSSGSVNLKTKMATSLIGSTGLAGYPTTIIKGKKYKLTLKDGNGHALANKTVTIKIKGKKYKKTTNSKGVVRLTIKLAAGKTYNLSYKYAGDSYYNKSSNTIKLSVKLPTNIQNSGSYVINNSWYAVCLKDINGKAVSGRNVTLSYNGLYYNRTTDSEGKAYLWFTGSSPMTDTLKYSFSGDYKYLPSAGSQKLEFRSDKVFTFNQIVAASKTLRKYVEKNSKLPETVSVNGVNLNITTFAYLMGESVINLNNGKTPDVQIVSVSPTYSNNGNNSLKANLYKSGYIELTKKLINYINKNHRIPNYIDTDVGRLSPNLYIFGISKTLDFYSTDSYLPNYIILNTDDLKPSPTKKGNSAQYKKGLNEVGSISSDKLSKFITASGNDAINSAIQKLANKLVSGKTTTWAKATAIFNYVRDNIQYEYYADTKYKASGTLSYKRGNCCDHANLIVSLCRAAKIPARFSHAQGCTFSSGLVTGHVWAQIYVNGVWYSADATSKRNSLGNIQNWNTNSYSSFKRYYHLPF